MSDKDMATMKTFIIIYIGNDKNYFSRHFLFQ